MPFVQMPQSRGAVIEGLESRRLLCATAAAPAAPATPSLAPSRVVTAQVSHAGKASTKASKASAPIDVTGSFAGSAKLKPAVRHAHSAKYPLTLTLTDTAGAVTGTGSFTGLADVALTGTLTGRHLVLAVDGGAGRITATVNKHGTSFKGKVLNVVASGQTYRGTFSAKAPPSTGTGGTPVPAGAVPRPDHVVIVVEENHSYGDVLGTPPALPPGTIGIPGVDTQNQDPYIRSLAKGGASFTNARAETHPSQPNYLALFSGSTQGSTSDASPSEPLAGPDLGGELIAAGLTFTGYSEDLPRVGFTGDTSGDYARKHNPWSDFADVPPESNQPFTAFPRSPDGFANLPAVSFVVPNQQNDMHSGSVQAADQWLKDNLGSYANWAQSHNSLLIVTWDEGSGDNHIATIFSGQSVKSGDYGESVDHYRMLRTIEDMYGLPPANKSASTAAITDVWK